jgi:hypothetical protein
MPSVFTLFGDLQMDTGAFARSARNADLQLLNLQGRLAKTEAAATRVGTIGFNSFAAELSKANREAGSLDARLKGLATNLSGFQKRQLSFQANDIITGLLSGQNITQILAQQGGQIVQTFQQGKAASEGMAVATKATATSMGEAAGAATLFGTSIVTIGATLAVALTAIAAAYKISKDIRTEAEKRLKTEESITAALNAQYLTAVNLKKELAEGQSGRDFGRFLQSGDIIGLKSTLARLQGDFDSTRQSTITDINNRIAEADRFGLTGSTRTAHIGAATNAEQTALQKLRAEQIVAITAQLDAIKNAGESGADWIKRNQQQALAVDGQWRKAALDAEKDFQAERKKMIDESIRKAKEFAAHIKKLTAEDSEKFDKTISAYNLRSDAKNFAQGFISPKGTVSQELNKQLQAILGTQIQEKVIGFVEGGARGREAITRSVLGYGPRKKLSDADQSALDRKIIELTQGLDPKALTAGQNQLAAESRRREADRIEKDRDKVTKELVEALKNKTIVEIVNNAPENAVVTSGNASSTSNRYR